jgi:hypothetical protein
MSKKKRADPTPKDGDAREKNSAGQPALTSWPITFSILDIKPYGS